MSRLLSLFLFYVVASHPVFSFSSPTLIDLVVEGTLQSPRMTMTTTELMQGEPYLLVMMNNIDYPVSLHFEKFGQAVFTQNLQGSPHVGQEEVGLLAHTKVIWQFIPNDAGEFLFSLNSNQSISPNKIKLSIKATPPTEAPPSLEEVMVLPEEAQTQIKEENKKLPEKKPNPSHKFFGRG